MGLHRVQVVLHTTDNNPANYVTNTMYWDDGETETYSTLVTEIVAAYNEIGNIFSSVLSVGGHEVNFYAMSDPEPRAPVFQTTWSLSGVGATSMPREVAMCVSFQAARISGVNQARRRGRLYLGPFGTGALTTATGQPSSTIIAACVSFGEDLLGFSQGQADWKWAVYSTIENTGSEVDNGWVDNAFDTQRRRGNEWTSRTTFI